MSHYERKQEEKKEKERGAKDDWEALKIVLDSLPTLKQRVLRRIQEIKNRKKESGVKISKQAEQDYRREANRKKNNK